ncbi:MAG: lantibiotic dehydratase [Ktedonobacteraceae bacterium]|nr:lantibiotic dehydratase [Ktedonobacteraceae bacterium]
MSIPNTSTVPEHLISLSDTSWAIWRWSALRGAGFPAIQVLQLAMPAYAAAADLFLTCEAEAERAKGRVLARLEAEAEQMQGEMKFRLLTVLRQVKYKSHLPSLPFTPSTETQMQLDTLQAAYTSREQARIELRAQFVGATVQTLQSLAEVAQAERFCEAVLWQNRGAVRDGIESFLHKPIVSNPASKQRKHGQLIAKYLQRYCTKNETIGFFGPLGWGRWMPAGAALTVHPGPHLLAKRTVYLETWGFDALGEMLAQNSALLSWAIPRPMPFLYLSGTTLHIPFARPLQLSDAQASVLAACDGQKTAEEIADAVLRVPHPGLISKAEVFAILDELRSSRRITWTFEVSMEDWHPECTLRRQLERITPESLRQETLSTLDRLETARMAIAEAAGNVEHLKQALEHLDATFTNLTGTASTRKAGKTAVARTLVYEDCQRDIDLTLGPALLQELSWPLALLLTSARWFTYMAARFYRKAFRKIYITLVKKTGLATVDFAVFWSLIQPLIPTEPDQRLINALVPEFQKRWATVLNIPAGQHSIHYTSQDLQPHVQEAFHAPYAGWHSARHHSPDLMIDATSPEAVLRDEYQLVLGEFHQGTNTFDISAMIAQHPAIPDLLQAMTADLPEARVVPVYSRHILSTRRAHTALTLPKDWRFVFSADSADVPAERMLSLGQLVMEEHAGELIVRTRDGRQQFDLLDILDGIISVQVCDAFKILAPVSHTPRVTVDRLVICREAWRFAPDELPWAFHIDPLECYVGLRRWARAQQMPRFLFVRTPNEVKPYYVDLDSPIYVDLFAKAVRQAQSASTEGKYITISEMLPDPEHCWLPDANGNRYTSEIRIVVVDQLKPPVKNWETIQALHNNGLTEEETVR